jgi:hypothetical protein
MKNVLLTLLAVILILGALGAAGFAGYRYGYYQGALSTTNTEGPAILPGFGYGPHRMPMHDFGFDRGFGLMPGGMLGFGFFGPLQLLARLAFWGLVIWAIYMLIARSGWRLARTTPPLEAQSTPVETDAKE